MNFCGNCGTKRENHHHFCSECGESFEENIKEHPSKSIKKTFTFTPSETDIQTYKNHFAYNEKIESVAKVVGILMFFGCFALGQILSKLFMDLNSPLPFSLVPGFIGSIFIFIILFIMDVYRSIARKIYKPNYQYAGWGLQAVYNTFASAKLRNGEHRCIYCGNNRLYRKGIYASNSCTVNCTKCKAFLYYD